MQESLKACVTLEDDENKKNVLKKKGKKEVKNVCEMHGSMKEISYYIDLAVDF